MKCMLKLILVVAVSSSAFVARAETEPWTDATILNDPEWRKSFLGSYGFLSGAEPQINPEELLLLREVIEVMKANPAAAASMLEPQIGAGSSASLDFILANLQFQNGNREGAKASYQSSLEKFPDFRRAHKNLGLLFVQESDCKNALPHLTRAVELGDRDGRNFGLIGFCYVNEENFVAAESAYRNSILQQPETRDWKLGLARSLLGMQKYEEAVALFETLIEADPGDTTAWMAQANAYIGLNQPMKAAVNLEAVRLLDKARTSSLVLLGDIYMNAAMWGLAKEAYLDAISRAGAAPEFDTAYRAADLLIRAHAYDDAKEVLDSINQHYGKAMKQDQELRVLTLKAKVARGTGRKEEAAQLLESIVKRDGTRGEALLELASYYRAQGNVEKALLMLERAAKLEKFEHPALIEQAQLMVASKDYSEAAQLLRKALSIKYEPRIERYLARVEQSVRR